jgi:tetratricopeptide (TPR) repeat protein
MGHSKKYFILICLFFALPWISHGQNEFPVNEWVKRLSDKNDLISHRIFMDTIGKIDYPGYCPILKRMYDMKQGHNTWFQIRIDVIYAQYVFGIEACPEGPQTIDLLNEALQKAYEIEDDWLIAEVYQLTAYAHTVRHNIGAGLMYGLLAKELREKIGEDKFVFLPTSYYELGFVQYHTRDYKESLENLIKALNHPGSPAVNRTDTLSEIYKMFAWNTIGLCYEKLGNYDQAFEAFDHSLRYAKKNQKTFWQGLVQGNRGDVFFKQGNYDSAQVLLNYDYKTSVATENYDNAANSLQWLARITLLKGNAVQALNMATEARQWLNRMPNADYDANLLYTFGLIYKNLGNPDSTFTYLEKYRNVHDAEEKRIADNRTEIVRLRLDNRDNVQKILTLNKEKKRIALIRNFIIALILSLAAVGYLYFNRVRLKLKMKQQQFQAEAVYAREQLNLFTENLREKNKLVETLQEQLLNKELNEEQIEHIHELSQHSILTDQDWEQFKVLFNKVYPAFLIDLKQKVSDITLAEQRMAALIKLKVTPKDAATMLGISQNSVYKSRQRLRQRLGLAEDDDLEIYF